MNDAVRSDNGPSPAEPLAMGLVAMRIREGEVAALRAFLAGDPELFERLASGVDGPGYDALFAAAFVEAVVRRFGRTRLKSDVVRYVASVRVRQGDAASDLEPVAAERLMRAALGEVSAVAGMDRELVGRTQVVLLDHLVGEERMDAETLDAFLAAARARAERLSG